MLACSDVFVGLPCQIRSKRAVQGSSMGAYCAAGAVKRVAKQSAGFSDGLSGLAGLPSPDDFLLRT